VDVRRSGGGQQQNAKRGIRRMRLPLPANRLRLFEVGELLAEFGAHRRWEIRLKRLENAALKAEAPAGALEQANRHRVPVSAEALRPVRQVGDDPCTDADRMQIDSARPQYLSLLVIENARRQ
jgi:hypothetical protein